MKKRKILALFPLVGLLLSGCTIEDLMFWKKKNTEPEQQTPSEDEGKDQEGQEGEGEGQGEEGGETINHQDPFVTTIENPSATRNFDSRFDEMADDFSGSNPVGETEATIAPSKLRVLVDSSNSHKPNSPDAAIYKIGTGTHDIDTFDGIGFKMRMVGNKSLKLSNLVLGLRGGDGYQVYPVKLSEAVDPDGDALPELTEEFQDIVISPQLSIEDANTLYKNLDGTDSELKVLEEILGIHLYMLDEECSAIVEIEEVFLVKAGDKTVMDNFSREAVNKADDTCWWRDSTGFIVRKGLNLKGKSYKAPNASKAYENLVLTVSGDTSGASVKVGETTVNWADLKDSENASVSSAVNGAYFSFVINATNSGLGALTGGFTLSSTSELELAGAFYTDLEVPAPVLNYPTWDANSFAMFDNFQRTQSGFNGNYETASTDPVTLAAGLSYQLSYNNGDKVSINGQALVFDATELGAADYINYKACNDNVTGAFDYMIMALKAEDGATLDNFRFNIGNGVTYVNQMFSAEGLKVATLDQADYPYIRAGYTWLVIDLAASGMSRGVEPFIDYYYSGEGKLFVDFVAFANAERDEYIETKAFDKEYEDGAGYDYAGYVYSAPTNRFIKMEITTTGTIDSIRFEGFDGAKWFHEGVIKDMEGNTIPETSGSGTYYIDLVASGIKEEGTEQDIHVHGDGTNGAVAMSIFTLELKAKTQDVLYVEKTYAEDADYAYAGYLYSPAESRFMKLVAETEGTIDSIRFEGFDGAKWFHEGVIKDMEGNTIPQTSGSGTYYIDLVASGIKEEGTEQHIHVHGDGGNGAVTMSVFTLELKAKTQDVLYVEKTYADGAGYDYAGYVYSPAESRFMKFVDETEGTIDSIRFEGFDGAKWFHDEVIKDQNGNTIPGTASGGTYIIDLVASGIKEEGTAQGIHVHGDGTNGAIDVKIYSIDAIPSFNDVGFVDNSPIADLTGYAYVGGVDNFGAAYLVLELSSEDDGVDLRSLRIESGEVTAWVKDGQVIDADGNAVDKETVVTSVGITIVVDLEASNLVGPAIHLHIGGIDGSEGSITVSAKIQYRTNSYGHLLISVDR